MQRIPELGPEGLRHRSAAAFVLALIGKQKAATAWGAVTSTAWMTSQAMIPVAIGRAIDLGIARDDGGEVIRWALVLLLLGLVRAATGIAFFRHSVITRVVSGALTVRMVTRHVTRLGAALPRRKDADDLIATATSDGITIGDGMLYAGRIIGATAAIVVVTVAMLTVSVPMGLLVLVTVPLLTGLSSLLLRPLHARQDEYRELQGKLAGRAVDIASGLRVLRGVGGERQFAARFRVDSARLRVADADVSRAEADLEGSRILVPGLITAVVTTTAVLLAVGHSLTIGQVVAFYGFATFLILPLTDFMEGMGSVTQMLVAARRVTRLLNTEAREVSEVTADVPGTGGEAHLTDGASGLDVPPATFTAVACADPGDADALARRLAGFEDTGDPALGGEPLSSLPVSVVRSRVLLGLNSDRFFAGTIREELAPDGTAGADRITAALEIACATDVVDALPDGLDARMTGRGRTFSGGQLQRLRLARALLADAEFTVLVEPTNAVDAYTEYRVAENLARFHDGHPAGRSTVVFTVSPLLLQRADRVAFVRDGRVTAAGTHDELLRSHPAYRTLVARDDVSQVGK
ncbi:ABC-type multidrug transport system, ATPase and permease component [Lentzea xinjiangensis]|uniref:ABC-type multidrug transport system, ATPase and permease component n=1 Tax=Lentzea xinjiangensis TaxID=402600 RepID=A0A1H9KQX4_9PSEU|nr:ABC transporter ATP-binding protein [Lentzea xinjiangensis]SER01512.1 ABC-type multidrug transport system, ATPase and permease component [Lentzea xinjiangensis]